MDKKTAKEREVHYAVTRSQSTQALLEPHPTTAAKRAPGDIHLHLYMGGLQYWVWEGDGWVEARVGFAHPVIGRTRVISHLSPQDTKLPTWVLNTSLSTYNSRKRSDDGHA